ncbi:uncharacterized protein At4g08330, chloroplastic [Ziziphus jujuba]|uniref:Uncharacterized protein At4g08330, chloroplastic n=1 Tax=Ziziphus jujuba TaxID=326968 RepID=A0A6P4APH5_ZIZJJ|nr:uncharacterized protein At4g08330, chloroplastic [Ziziphus jujuba]
MIGAGDGDGDDSCLHQNIAHLPLSSSQITHVSYSCGTCGYELNLNSDNRNTPTISSNYHKLIKRGTISFFCIDESRFKQTEKRQCRPYFTSKSSWGLFRRRTKLLCRKCGNHIGNSYKVNTSSSSLTLGKLYSITWDGISDCRIYDIKIRALQPSVSEKISVSAKCR